MSIKVSEKNLNNFYASQLNSTYYNVYKQCIDNLEKGVLNISVPLTKYDEAQVNMLTEAIVYGCPELFYISQIIQYTYNGSSIDFSFNNKFANKDLDYMWNKLNEELDSIAECAKQYGNHFDQIRYVNQFISFNIETVPSTDESYSDAYSALFYRRARCEGISKLATLILDKLGIYSFVASGSALNEGQNIPHGWNIVRVNGESYHCDFTWNIALHYGDVPGEVYLFMDDNIFYVEHTADYKYEKCNDNTKTFWMENGGDIGYQHQIARCMLKQYGNDYMTMARFDDPLSSYDLDYVFDWMANDLSGYSYGSNLRYSYRPEINILIMYFLN